MTVKLLAVCYLFDLLSDFTNITLQNKLSLFIFELLIYRNIKIAKQELHQNFPIHVTLWCSWSSNHLQYWHPVWFLVWILGAPLLASSLCYCTWKSSVRCSGTWAPATQMIGPDSWTTSFCLVQLWPFVHLRAGAADGRFSLCVSISVCLWLPPSLSVVQSFK